MEQLKNPFKLTTTFWKSIGALVLREVRKDTKEGLFQNNLSKLRYKSLQYARQKAAGMRRVTKGGKLKDFDPSHDYPGRRLYGKKTATTKGGRLSGFEGKKIASTNVAFVDMTLTGETLAGFHVKQVDPQGVTMAYNSADTDKIIGNQKHGYDIVGLNDKNRLLVKNEILKELGLSAKDHKQITINVNL